MDKNRKLKKGFVEDLIWGTRLPEIISLMIIFKIRLMYTGGNATEQWVMLQTLLFLCGNKMPTRCNRGFYCRSYCLLNMFRAPLCPSSGAQEWLLPVVFRAVVFKTNNLKNHSTKYHRQQPLYNTLELLMMGIVVPETWWASNKICNKNLRCIQLVFYFHIIIRM